MNNPMGLYKKILQKKRINIDVGLYTQHYSITTGEYFGPIIGQGTRLSHRG